jgi:hypothetical protein
MAFGKQRGPALRRLAQAGGTLITPEGETNPLGHEIEQADPGWRKRVKKGERWRFAL